MERVSRFLRWLAALFFWWRWNGRTADPLRQTPWQFGQAWLATKANHPVWQFVVTVISTLVLAFFVLDAWCWWWRAGAIVALLGGGFFVPPLVAAGGMALYAPYRLRKDALAVLDVAEATSARNAELARQWATLARLLDKIATAHANLAPKIADFRETEEVPSKIFRLMRAQRTLQEWTGEIKLVLQDEGYPEFAERFAAAGPRPDSISAIQEAYQERMRLLNGWAAAGSELFPDLRRPQ